MPHPCGFCPIGDASDVIGEITEETLAECASCGWIGKCEQREDGKWRLPTHKRLMAKDDQLPLPDRLKVVWHGAQGYARMASASDASTYQIPRTRHTYCHWEMTSMRYRPMGFEYWTDERLANPPKATFL
jgi:hypothetical protein